jgi:hypothetical protein
MGVVAVSVVDVVAAAVEVSPDVEVPAVGSTIEASVVDVSVVVVAAVVVLWRAISRVSVMGPFRSGRR